MFQKAQETTAECFLREQETLGQLELIKVCGEPPGAYWNTIAEKLAAIRPSRALEFVLDSEDNRKTAPCKR